MTNTTRTLPALLVAAALCFVGCTKQEESEDRRLTRTISSLHRAAFGEEYDQGLALLDRLAETTRDKGVAYRALTARALGHLNLLLATLLKQDEALAEQLERNLGWQLEGGLDNPRNFQLLAQEILEMFKVVAREAGDYPDLQKRAAALALFTEGLQGTLFRSKQQYVESCRAVRDFEDLAYLSHATALRDLVVETLHRRPTPGENWQHILLTTLAPVCPKPAARFLDMLCMAHSPTTAEEFCHPSMADIPEIRRRRGQGYLSRKCRLDSADEKSPVGMDALRDFYEAACGHLTDSSPHVPAGLLAVAREVAAEKEEAFQAIEKLLFY